MTHIILYGPHMISHKEGKITGPKGLAIPKFKMINNSIESTKDKKPPATHKTDK